MDQDDRDWFFRGKLFGVAGAIHDGSKFALHF